MELIFPLHITHLLPLDLWLLPEAEADFLMEKALFLLMILRSSMMSPSSSM